MARDFATAAGHSLSVPFFHASSVVDFTMALWVKYDANQAGQTRTFISNGDTGAGGVALAQQNSGGPLVQSVANAVTWLGGGFNANVGVWEHYCYLRSGADNRIYRNGIQTETNQYGGFNAVSGQFWIGGPGAGGHNVADAKMGEAAFWNIGLSPTEVLMLSKGVSPQDVRRPSLLGHWPVYGSSPEIDLSGFLRNLTVGAGAPPLTDHCPMSIPVAALCFGA